MDFRNPPGSRDWHDMGGEGADDIRIEGRTGLHSEKKNEKSAPMDKPQQCYTGMAGQQAKFKIKNRPAGCIFLCFFLQYIFR